jgi:hypothetical protein
MTEMWFGPLVISCCSMVPAVCVIPRCPLRSWVVPVLRPSCLPRCSLIPTVIGHPHPASVSTPHPPCKQLLAAVVVGAGLWWLFGGCTSPSSLLPVSTLRAAAVGAAEVMGLASLLWQALVGWHWLFG